MEKKKIWEETGTTEILDDTFVEEVRLSSFFESDEEPELLDVDTVHKNLENTIELLATDISSWCSPDEEIEILEEEVDDFSNPLKSLEDTIELLDITCPIEPIRVKKKITPKKKPWIILLTCCFTIIFGTFGYLYFWQRDSMKTNAAIEKIVENTKVETSFSTGFLLPEQNVSANPQYFQYLNVDFTDLINQNSDVKGWIKVPNTQINYPFVQTTNNDFYLKHSFDKSNNSAGWVFADFRNNFTTLDQNTILYAHGRLDNTMFGSLKQVVEKEWYENKENRTLQLSLLESNSIWEVFSVYTILPETYYITPSFDTDEEYQEFLNTIQSRSVYDFSVNLSLDDKVLTLSSCYNDTLRVVLHARLVNIEEKN